MVLGAVAFNGRQIHARSLWMLHGDVDAVARHTQLRRDLVATPAQHAHNGDFKVAIRLPRVVLGGDRVPLRAYSR
jgi:hypothetical protein